MQKNLTQGPITKTLVFFALPMIGGNMLQQLYNIADTLIVGRFIGSGALAAVGSSYTLMTFLTSILLGLCMGSGAVFSIRYGEGDMEKLHESLGASFVLILAVAAVLNLAVFLLIDPIMYLLQVPEEIYAMMREYLWVIFWGILALIWLWDLWTNYTTFERNRRYSYLVAVLYAMPFLYPLLSWVRGMEFPMMTTTVMPCSVAVFTIGLLLGFSRKVNLLIILFICHWALISFSKIYVYHIPEDVLLAASTVPAIYLFFKNYFDQNLHKETKPSARFMNGFLITICVIIGIALSLTLMNGLIR